MTQKQLDAKINKIKSEILKIDALRPGSLAQQFNVCGVAGCRCKDKKNPQKHGPYFNLNYVHQGKKKTQFIRDQFAKEIERQNKNFKRFKELSQMWITLEIEKSNLFMKSEIEKNDAEKIEK
jgi:hypothetical protein